MKRAVPVYPHINVAVRVCDVLWLSTYQFAVVYHSSGEDKGHPNLFVAHVAEKNETRETIWRTYEDPCYSNNFCLLPCLLQLKFVILIICILGKAAYRVACYSLSLKRT